MKTEIARKINALTKDEKNEIKSFDTLYSFVNKYSINDNDLLFFSYFEEWFDKFFEAIKTDSLLTFLYELFVDIEKKTNDIVICRSDILWYNIYKDDMCKVFEDFIYGLEKHIKEDTKIKIELAIRKSKLIIRKKIEE